MTDKLIWIPRGEWRRNNRPRGNNKMEFACGNYWIALFNGGDRWPQRGYHANRIGEESYPIGDAPNLADAKALCEADLIKTGKGQDMTKVLDWKRDGDGWHSSAYFEIQLMADGDPPKHAYLLTLGNTVFGSYDTLEAAQAKAEKLHNSTHPETAAAVRRALDLQPPYPVAEAIPYPQAEKREAKAGGSTDQATAKVGS